MASKHREWVTYGFENTLSMCINAGIHVDGEMRSVMKEKDRQRERVVRTTNAAFSPLVNLGNTSVQLATCLLMNLIPY